MTLLQLTWVKSIMGYCNILIKNLRKTEGESKTLKEITSSTVT